jgi:hypothetical protein
MPLSNLTTHFISSFWQHKGWQNLTKRIIIATAAASCLADAEDMVTQVSDAPPNGIAL